MQYRRLGATGLKVSAIGIGTFQFSGEWGKDFAQREVDAILDRAREVGINLLDTAECYGDHLSETLIGNAIRATRSDWIVATKFGHQTTGFQKRENRWSPLDVEAQLNASLRALNTDYVDIYQFHSGSDDDFRQDGLWEMLNRQVKAGKVRFLGISLGYPYSECQLKSATRVKADVIQVRYNRIERVAEEVVLPFCAANDIGVLARNPLASGLLTGKYGADATFATNDFRSRIPGTEVREKLVEVEQLKAQLPQSMKLPQWALSWCLQHPAVSCIIPGCKDAQQLEENSKAAHDETMGSHPQAWRS